MSVFMYAPGFKIYISTQKNGILDISDDVTGGTMVRRSSGVSSLSFTLQNARRKYDGIFVPNDRIVVMMKRLAWMRVFTGYLNAVPLVTAWPMAVQITASCSLKRLQYYYWDPGLAVSQTLVANALSGTQQVGGTTDDGGTANAIVTLLQTVAGWPAANTHIAGIPQTWLKWAYKIAKNVQADLAQADQLAQQFYAILGANGVVSGQIAGGAVASNALPAGTYGGQKLNAAQAKVAVIVYNAGMAVKATSQDIATALAAAYAESQLGAVTTTAPSGQVGLYGRAPGMGWGTAAQLADPTYQANKFFELAQKITGRDKMTVGQLGQAVLRTSGGNQAVYQQMAPLGTAVIAKLNAGSGGTIPGPVSVAPALQGTSGGKAGKTSSNAYLQTALAFVQQRPSVPYRFGNDSPPNTPAAQVQAFDCSSFVQWTYFQTNGSLGSCPRTSEAQSAWCKSGGSILPPDQGLKTQGALMFIGQPGAAHHVEISLGDGTHTVGFHHTGTFGSVITTSASTWTCAGIMPGLDYSGAAGAGGPATSTNPMNAGVQLSTGSAQPWYDKSDPFDTLFGSSPWVPEYNIDVYGAEALTGPRALIADSPLLPYIKQLCGSCMRQFSSAPNGDFIAWFPDYYGLWGTAAVMQIEPIELRDFNVWWDDTNLVTHQFVVTPPAVNQLALDTGTVQNIGPLLAVTTTGVATIDIPAIMYALFGLEPTQAEAQKFIAWVYKRFGARPDFQQVIGPIGPKGEFFAALNLFMQSWAYQYNADIPITFMPELWPGMLVQIPSFGFQAYVTTVTHTWQMGPGGGYSTTVNIAAPARLPGSGGNSQGALIGMPIAGGLTGNPAGRPPPPDKPPPSMLPVQTPPPPPGKPDPNNPGKFIRL
jgi:cell wall-associated NlpC family hydrolase